MLRITSIGREYLQSMRPVRRNRDLSLEACIQILGCLEASPKLDDPELLLSLSEGMSVFGFSLKRFRSLTTFGSSLGVLLRSGYVERETVESLY